mmetsp:Transcript_26979/g.58556  ORF Transcript_26979/g.58556 Transcript_26979/m.58556 type:complete len:83 (+) Transcript_26979:457-705(+)
MITRRQVEGWWTYEFCYGKTVRQFHQENKVTTTDYSLGRFRDHANKVPEPVRPKDGEAQYSQFFIDGTTWCASPGRPVTLWQ